MKALSWSVLFGFAFVSMTSWAGYYTTGQFLGAEAWAQGLASPTLMIDHVVEIAPVALVLVPAAALCVVLLNARVTRLAYAWPVARARMLVYGVATTLALAAGVAGVADVASERDTTPVASGRNGPTVTPHEEFVSMGMDKSGPIARLLVDAFRAVAMTTMRAGSGERGERVISPGDYAARVRRERRNGASTSSWCSWNRSARMSSPPRAASAK